MTARFFVIFFFIAQVCAAQNGVTGHPDWQIKPAVNSGFIMVHRISLGHLVKGFPTLYEINISKPTLGNKLWHIENNLPDLGITLQYLDYKNPAQLGVAYTIAPYVEIPFRRDKRLSRLVMRMAWGATYITKSFDIRTNHKNVAIGSAWNCFAQFRWFWQLPLSKNVRFEPGFTFSHASNGRLQNPNLGLNVISLNAALNIVIPGAHRPEVITVDSSLRAKSRYEMLFFVATGMNERRINTDNIHTTVFSAAIQRNKGNTHKFAAAADVFLDDNYILDIENDLGYIPTGIDRTRIALKAGYSYNIGRVSLPFEAGYYVFQKVQPDGPVVTRLGVRYYAPGGLVALFGLRTHFAVAYNFEFGLGYCFPLKKSSGKQ